MKHLSDKEIIDSVLRGNTTDYSLLIDRYKDRTFSLLKRMLKNSLDAEEVLQDTFLKVFYALKDFKGESQFSTWLYRISYNNALSVIASSKRKIQLEMTSFEEESDFVYTDNEIYSQSENSMQYIYKLIDKLPVRNAVVLILFYVDGFTLNEISKILNISIVNTKVILHRSRNTLRNLLIKHNYLMEEK